MVVVFIPHKLAESTTQDLTLFYRGNTAQLLNTNHTTPVPKLFLSSKNFIELSGISISYDQKVTSMLSTFIFCSLYLLQDRQHINF